jgi:hypothetical protein
MSLPTAIGFFDSGPAVIKELRRRIGLAAPAATPSPLRGFSSGPVDRLDAHLRVLLGLAGDVQPLGI